MTTAGSGKRIGRIVSGMAVVVAAAVIAGCATPSAVNIPEKSFLACQQVKPETADSHWAVLTWYADVYADPNKAPQSVVAARAGVPKAEAVIRSRWTGELAAKHPFLTAAGEGLTLGDANAAAARDVKAALDALDDGVVLLWIEGLSAAKAFGEWATGQPHKLAAKTDATAAAYQGLAAALDEKAKAALAQAQQLAADQKFAEAYAALREARALFARTVAAGPIGEAVRAVTPSLLVTAIQAAQADGFETVGKNDTVTQVLYARRREWLADDDLKEAFAAPTVQAAFAKLQQDLGKARGQVWQTEMQALADKKFFWKLYLYQQEKLKATADYEEPVKQAAQVELWAKFQALLPSAFKHFTAVAQDEIDKGERHGSALILYGMIREIAGFVTAHQQELGAESAALVKEVEGLEAQSQKFIKLFVSRKLLIQEILPKDGLGTELKGDLEAEFSELSKSCPLLYGLSLGAENTKITPKDYVMSKGIYATLEAVYSPENVVQENVTLAGEVEAKDNPKYLQAVEKGKKTDGIPPKLYTENSYQYTINRKTTEAVATARLNFMLEYEDHKDNIKINLSESLKRIFLQEAIDPNLTKKIAKPVSGPAPDRQTEPKPKLRTDRVLTLLEMKEWARGETKKLTVMRLLSATAALPLQLAAKGDTCTKENNWPVAANFRGICLEYCRNVDPDAALKSELFCLADPPAYLKDDYAQNTKLVQNIKTLKEGLWAACVEALVKYLEKE